MQPLTDYYKRHSLERDAETHPDADLIEELGALLCDAPDSGFMSVRDSLKLGEIALKWFRQNHHKVLTIKEEPCPERI